jgi:hypothetical protein
MCFPHHRLGRNAVVAVVVTFALGPVAGQAQTAVTTKKAAGKISTTWKAPRTPDGQPDLQGVWSFATVTPLERPSELAAKEFLTDKEAAELEQQTLARRNQDRRDGIGTDADVSRGYNQFWYDFGRFIGDKRTSLVVDPHDGKVPPLTRDAANKAEARAEVRRRAPAGPEDRNIAERCILGFNSGPPMIPSQYNNNVQLFQSTGYVVILTEMIHEARIVPMDKRPHLGQSIRQWMGDSRGRWEGDTLVIETTNFTNQARLSYDPGDVVGKADENLQLVERFTRVDAGTLLYEFTLNDPTTWTMPWSAQIPMRKQSDEIYEYACHEGNYSMFNMLTAARAQEKAAAEAVKGR